VAAGPVSYQPTSVPASESDAEHSISVVVCHATRGSASEDKA